MTIEIFQNYNEQKNMLGSNHFKICYYELDTT